MKSPDQPQTPPKAEYTVYRTPLEKVLAEIWAEVLGLEQVGAHDNFFNLGGDSILATLVVSRVRRALQLELSLVSFFEKPTVTEMALSLETTGQAVSAPQSRTLQPISREEIPLSHGQERMWFFDQLEPGNPIYNRPVVLRLTGRLDAHVLERCLNEIIARHEILRTNFSAAGGEPVQVINPGLRLKLRVTDLSDLTDSQREGEALCQAVEESRKPFDLVQEGLVRATLFRLSEQEHLLLWLTHHIVFDGWSDSILLEEFTALYTDLMAGRSPSLPQLALQYADYTLWQRSQFEDQACAQDLSYWKRQLDNAPQALNLATDRPRPPRQTYRGARHTFSLPVLLSDQLKELSRRAEVTRFMTLFAAFNTLLYRYTGQQDLLVGVPVAGRNRVETERLIGVFINTLALRTELTGNLTFLELLQRIRKVTLEAYQHQELPFERLVETLRPDRDLSRAPLFQVMFQLRNLPKWNVKIPGLRVDPIKLDIGVARFDLTLEVDEMQRSLECTFEYSTDLFNPATIDRMQGHFQTLLVSITANPEQRLSDLPLMTQSERHQLLVEWNDTDKDYPSDKRIHELFEEQVERTPDSVAVVFEGEALTYRELNRRANQLAHYLIGLGVGPEVLVGICLERSMKMVVAVLGVIKSGGAYVPLDPSYPRERLRFMIEDAQATAVLTQDRLVESFSRLSARVICPDRYREEIALQSERNPEAEAKADNLAYVIFTSGSTGKPKGVQVPHRTAMNLLSDVRERLRLDGQDTSLFVASLSFDISVMELFFPLSVGARIVVVSSEVAADGPRLIDQLSKSRATVMHATPATWRLLVQAGWQGRIAMILCGGEALQPDLAAQLVTRGASVWNLYGPTETTIYSSAALYRPELSGGKVSIGRPIANTRIYLLDGDLRPVPIGVAGELYIGGAGVARGYLNRSELTAEKFIPDPYSVEPGARLYRTGDLACYFLDGNIEYLGRIDHQVKIRGFRIELGEIESVLSQHHSVLENVVMAREDNSGDHRLVAYVITRNEASVTISALRDFLKEKLPEYMVPSAFVFLDSLPLTPNGKLDRAALPQPDQTRPELRVAFIAPRTPVEALLAKIWAEVLNLERVGIHDNFFELGGHSLLATQVVSRVRQAFQMELPLRSLFEIPTVAGLAECIEEIRRGKMGLQGRLNLPVLIDGGLPLSFSQQRLWFLDQYEPNSSVYNIPNAERLSGTVDVAIIEQSLNEILRRHESLRTTFSMVEGQPVQVISPSRSIPLHVIDLTDRAESDREEEARQLAHEEARRPFDLSRGPLFRATLIRLAHDDHMLVLTMHHIVSDGWSMGVLDRELSVLYEAFCAGKPSPLSELPIQYGDFAIWQREWLQGDVLDTQLSFWRKQLENVQTLQLRTDRPRPAVQSYRGVSQSIVLSGELTDGLKTLSRQQDVTLFMTLLAAFQTLLHRYTGQNDIVVGSPIANRNRPEIEGMIGFFVNTLVFRNDFSKNPTFRDLLTRVRESSLDAYAHQDLPFEKLVEEIQPERTLSNSPLFQVMFVFQNAPRWSLILPGLTLAPVKMESETAKFDLLLSMSEQHQSLRATLQYNTDLFDGATITRVLGHLETLLNGVVTDPACRLSDLPLLPTAERVQLLREWNDTVADLPEVDSVHEFFEKQATNTPEMIAVAFCAEKLTYRQLNQRADQLARRLRTLGVRSGISVGICMNRSVELMVALLAVLKAGGAYVPLDPTYPKDRLSFMLNDAQVSVLLTQERLVKDLPENRTRIMCLDQDWEDIGAETAENYFDSRATGQDLAYLIYTSGSTGTPKAVAMNHRALCNLIAWQIRNFSRPGPANTLQFASLSFDVSFQEIFSTWCSGGTLLLVSEELRWDAVGLLRFLKDEAVERLFLPYVALQQLAEAAVTEGAVPTHLHDVITAGEQLRITGEIANLFNKLRDCTLQNQYGPSESHVVTTYTLTGSPDSWPALPAIGRPIANATIFILDRDLNPVPIGVPGEIHIGGVSLASGYFNRRDLTSERFIPHPFSKEPGARLYKTGDLARYRSDGEIEFLGRIDNQVKIRGFRIELGEIESTLGQHPSVLENVVIAREDTSGDNRLVAYVITRNQASVTISTLHDFLKEKLPDYMVPSQFVFLDSLPLTSNGKLDRLALPQPDQIRPELIVTFVAPRTPLEELLAGIWVAVLKVEKVGVHDNFFELGGHSLLTTQVISRMHDTFGLNLPVRTLFENPTIEGLANMIQTGKAGGSNNPVTALTPLSRQLYSVKQS